MILIKLILEALIIYTIVVFLGIVRSWPKELLNILCGIECILLLFLSSAVIRTDFYPEYATVTKVDELTNEVIVKTPTGILWSFYGTEDWCIGDGAALIICSNGTKEIADDLVLSAKYVSG